MNPRQNMWNIIASAHRGTAYRRMTAGGGVPNPAPILQQTAPSVPVSTAVAAPTMPAPAPVKRVTPTNGGRHHAPKAVPKGYKRKPVVSFDVGSMLDMEEEAFAAQVKNIRDARRMRGRGVKSADVSVLAKPGVLVSTVGATPMPSPAEITGQPDLVGQNPLEPDRRTVAAGVQSAMTTSARAVAPATVAPAFGVEGGSVSIAQSRGLPGVVPASVDGEKQHESGVSGLFRRR